MKHISQKQGGMTALGIFLILAMLACFVVFGLRAFPLYNEYLTVKSAMESVVATPPAKRKTTKQVRTKFLRNVELNNVERFTDASVKELVNVKKSKDGKKKYLNVKYQAKNKLFKNVFLMMDVDETLELTGKAPE
ncbi:MAG: hypothetical protein DHS20C09_17460 [marine bacterium B5-7]|nr:MAG: hypothetical protein DHS20C09_17460 [marine bacterium B5-7]